MNRLRTRLVRAGFALATLTALVVVLGADRQW
jgi:hypothetical protein